MIACHYCNKLIPERTAREIRPGQLACPEEKGFECLLRSAYEYDLSPWEETVLLAEWIDEMPPANDPRWEVSEAPKPRKCRHCGEPIEEDRWDWVHSETNAYMCGLDEMERAASQTCAEPRERK